MFQFGEVTDTALLAPPLTSSLSLIDLSQVLLEWSKERYAAQFSTYHDNIAGRSFEKQSVAQHIHTSSYTDSNTSCVLYHYFGPSSLILQYVSRPTH